MKVGDKVYLVKYVLSEGIEAETVNHCYADCVYLGGRRYTPYRPGIDVAATWPEAVQLAEQLRQKKLKSLRRQIEKLERIEFTKPQAD